MRVKGKFFPSFENANIRSQRMVRNYAGRPQSESRQLRNMRAHARKIIDSKDPKVIAVGDKVIRLCLDEPNPEFSALHLICAGIAMSKATDEPWTACMLTIIQKFEERHALSVSLQIEDKLTGQAEQVMSELDRVSRLQPSVGSRLRRWLQSVVPNAFRAKKAADA